MNTLILFIIVILTSAIINRVRGGLLTQVLPKGRGDDAAAIMFGCLAFACHQVWWVLPAFAVAFRLGEAHGWGHWKGVAVEAHTNRADESPIDWLLKPIKNVQKWAFLGLTLRGALWGLVLAIPTFFINKFAAILFIVVGATMGLLEFTTRKLSSDSNQRWAYGEYLLGAIFGIPLFMMWL